ncbi:predicted protein [Sclerotinia sclerotiorum 1980 UF-70]|uniref:Uncharacterized protein n=1 Tax=Sclerotinia sclerotiorum (strain ATCC 18683 / 1980 / Ss-1) TaxID=665079 RepID=A7F412_SCLS1|nr:predicted protein [Sclerotinia sclerotiorum 1980 UF-70]EDN97483.1 predicted protein [Sclerotinia sclerotiorum 1980 UF-70]
MYIGSWERDVTNKQISTGYGKITTGTSSNLWVPIHQDDFKNPSSPEGTGAANMVALSDKIGTNSHREVFFPPGA